MILVDTTIVSVANPAIKAALDPDTNNLDNVVWVTCAYLLAYAVPLLITGRLGDRFGPKRIYLIGLVVFTLASLGCGLSGTLELLIIARAVQGLGAALMTPQTMAVITRTFPPDRPRRGDGAVGRDRRCRDARRPAGRRPARRRLRLGVDLLHQHPGRHRRLRDGLDPRAEPADAPAPLRHPRASFLSAVGLFLIVFGLQEGEHYDWGVIWGPITVWGMIIAGVVVMGIFIWTQARTKSEPLVPLELFKERNFAVSQPGDRHRRLHRDEHVAAADVLHPARARPDPDPVGAAARSRWRCCPACSSPFAGKLLDRTDPRVPAGARPAAGRPDRCSGTRRS